MLAFRSCLRGLAAEVEKHLAECDVTKRCSDDMRSETKSRFLREGLSWMKKVSYGNWGV